MAPSETTAIWPGRPVWAMPAPARAALVSLAPCSPKSWEWLLALFMTVKPTWRRTVASVVGTRKAKQSVESSSHFDPVAEVSVPSRLPNTMGAAMAALIGSR